MERRTKYVINPAGRISRVRPSETAHILKKNPEIRLCTPEEIEAFTGQTVPVAKDEQTAGPAIPATPATTEEQIENLCKALKKDQMLDVIRAFDLPTPPGIFAKDGLAAIILDQENGYETAMNYAKA